MNRDRTLPLWTSDPVAQLPKGQGSLTFGEAEARVLASIRATEKPAEPAPELVECFYCGEETDEASIVANVDGNPICEACADDEEHAAGSYGPEDDGYQDAACE